LYRYIKIRTNNQTSFPNAKKPAHSFHFSCSSPNHKSERRDSKLLLSDCIWKNADRTSSPGWNVESNGILFYIIIIYVLLYAGCMRTLFLILSSTTILLAYEWTIYIRLICIHLDFFFKQDIIIYVYYIYLYKLINI